jgi:hypothetical protein
VHQQDLVVATQGRSFWILDDLTPLHAMRDAVRYEALHVFQPRDATLARFSAVGGSRAPEVPPYGVVMRYWIGEGITGDVEIRVLDAAGTVIRHFKGPLDRKVSGPAHDGGGEEGLDEGALARGVAPSVAPAAPGADASPPYTSSANPDQPQDPNLNEEELETARGMNRFVWDLRYPGPEVIPSAQFSLAHTGGMNGPPGTYTLRVEAGGERRDVTVRVGIDPRIPTVTEEDMAAQFALARQVRERLTEVHAAIREIRSIREQTGGLLDRLRQDDRHEALVAKLDSLRAPLDEELTAVERALIQVRNEVGQDPINFPPMLDDQLAYLYSHVTTSYGRPNQGTYQRFHDLVDLTQPFLDRVSAAKREQVAAFNRALNEAGVGPVVTK